MSVFNGEKYLSEAIESVLNQSFTDFEFIIIDDGSTDSSKNIINSYNDKRIKYYYKKNSGLSASLNFGLKLAKGKYIARLDADDICYNNRLMEQYTFMELNPDYVLCGSACDVVDVNNEFIYRNDDIPCDNNKIFERMKQSNCFIHSSTFYIRSTVVEIGAYYEPIIHYFEDYMLFYKLIKYGKAYNFKTPLIRYRLVPGSISSNINSKYYNKLKKQIVFSGIATLEQIKYFNNLRIFQSEKRKLSNYHASIFRLLIGHQLNIKKSLISIYNAIITDPLNIISYASLFYSPVIILKYFKNKFTTY